MNSKQVSLLAKNPFIKAFTLQIIKNIKESKIDYKFEEKIDIELVPKFTERGKPSILEPKKEEKRPIRYPPLIFRKKVYEKPKIEKTSKFQIPEGEIPKEALIPKKPIIEIKPKLIVLPKVTQIEKKPIIEPPKEKIISPPKVIPHPIMKVAPKVPPIIQKSAPQIKEKIFQGNGFEQLKLLLEDPSVSLIECTGAKKPLSVIRRGRKQPTKIILTEEEIKKYLNEISEKTHIPLLEGVFRTIIGPFSINAVISEIIGSKFIIKKHLF
ncbi:MAG: hypothetical protein WC494_01445 [Candidatus Pacearchaeota archaeon]